jgi:hypothetical protein
VDYIIITTKPAVLAVPDCCRGCSKHALHLLCSAQGGPGCASSFGGLYELGPYLVTQDLSLTPNPGTYTLWGSDPCLHIAARCRTILTSSVQTGRLEQAAGTPTRRKACHSSGLIRLPVLCSATNRGMDPEGRSASD